MANRINFQIGYSVDKAGLSEMQSLFQQIANKAKEPGNQLNTGLQKAAATANTLDGILEKTFNTNLGTLNVTKFNQELSKSGLTLKGVQSDLSLVGNQGATAYNRLAQAVLGTNLQLKESNKLLDSMAVTMANTVKWGITSSIFNSITSSIQQAYIYTKQLDTSLNDIRIVTDKSAESMARFAVEANTAAKQMGASTLDYTNASLIYYQQGLSDAEVAARAETTIKAANVTGQTGEAVSEQLTAVWNGYKVTAEETEAYIDKLAAVAATTAADLEELSIGMSKVASAANAMGVDFDDLNAQIATIVSVTRQAPESVGTALKTIYARLGDLKVDGVDEFGVKLGEVSAQMQTMGIQILDQNGDLRDMSSVIAEVAEKWTGWTSAQRQAAAVAMAGKRQYNNLIALFDNWDMYTDALNTSTDALGTLQQQQDIYMESTAAKLKTLKATWQDLYDGLINKDEIDAGIDGLTNLVQVFDNFIESFGGGLKSITAFGAVISNIFNKQIADAINGVIQRQEVFKQNLALAQTNAQIRSQGVVELGANATPQDLAIQANTKAQLEYAEKIYAARVGLNQEQYNTLINYQKEIGSLQEELTYIEEYNKKAANRYLQEEQYNAILKEGEEAVYATQEQYDSQIDKLQKIKNIVSDITTGEINIGAAKTKITSISNTLYNNEKQVVQELFNQNRTVTDIEVNEEKINKILDQQISKYKVSKNVAKQINDNRIKTVDLEGMLQNTKQEADAMLVLGNNATVVAQKVTTITSSLGTMAMAWSSVNSLIQTWNDESASFGDKITQSLMTMGMTIPMVISSFSKLNEVFGISSSLLDVNNAKLIAKGAVEKANIAIIKMTTTAEEAKIAMSKLSCLEDEKEVGVILSKISAKEMEAISTGELTATEVANNIANKEGIILAPNQLAAIEAKIIAKNAETAATIANTTATEANIVAQNALNASMLANPITWVVASLAALAGVAALVHAHYKKLREEAHAAAEESAKLASETRSEVEAHKELVQQFENLKEKYDAGTASKEELYDVTGKILEAYDLEGSRLDMLTGKYDQVTEAIKKKQKAEQEELSQQDKKAIEDSAEAVLEEGRKVGGSGRVSDNKYQVTLDSGLINAPGDYQRAIKKAQEIFGNDVTTSEDYIGNFTFDTSDVKNIIEAISKLEQWRDALKELGYETEPAYQHIEDVINAFNDENSLDTLKENQSKALEDILSNSILSITNSQEEFDNEIVNLQNKLKKALSEGIIPSDTDINKSIADYIGTLNTSLATNFTLEQGIREKFPNVNEELIKYFQQNVDEDNKLKFVDLIDFSLEPDKVKKIIDDFNTYFANQSIQISPPSFEMQTSMNEAILKGKDINKSDWESLLSSSPDAEQILGERGDFNNKSIGERISLMEELNRVTQEQAHLAIENYDEWKTAQENISKYLQEQIDLTVKQIEIENSKLNSGFISEEQVTKTREKIEELQNELENLTNEKYEVDIEIDDYFGEQIDDLLGGMADEVITQADQLKMAAESVGEAWTIAAEDVANFASVFPELMNEDYISWLENGSIQLTEAGRQLLNETLSNNQQIMNSNKEVVLEAIDDKVTELEADAEFQEKKIAALEEYLNSSITNTSAAQTAIDKINQAGAEYEETLRSEGLINEANAGNEKIRIGDESNRGLAEGLSSLNDIINAVRENYANIFNENYKGSLPGYKGSSASVSSQYQKGTYGNPGEEVSAEVQADIDAAKQELEKAKQQLSEDRKAIASYRGAQAKIRQGANEADTAADRVKSGKAGKESKSKGGGGGKGKEQKDKDEKEYKDEFDRYWEIKKAIDATDRAIKRLDKDQENLYGYELINSLKQENQLLEQQKQHYEQLAAAQKQEAAELQSVLSAHGVVFDASGAITNYAAATAAALAEYNAAIAQYNAGLIDASALEVYEKNYEAFKKALERYETLYYQEMQDTQDKLDDIWREELANNLKAWEVEVQLKLDMKELKRGWNDFINEVTDDFQKVYQDLRMDVRNLEKDAKTYIGEEGTISTIINAVHDVTNEIDKLRGGGSSDMFESISQAQEKLKELNEELEDAGKSLHDLWIEAWDNYLDGIDQVADKMDDLTDQFERINDELEFQKEIIELLYGPEAFALMNKYFQGQEKNTLEQIKSVKTQKDMWEDLWRASGATMDNQADWTKDQQKYYEEWQEAQSDLNDLVLEYIQLLKDDYLNTVNQVLKELEHAVTGSSLDDLATEWERISDHADKYYDSVEGAYEIQNLANKIDKSIAENNNLKAQQKLQALREREIGYLREKEHLTEYDLQAAEARYQIALKEIALEDAQSNKTAMKLTRNEQGNWSYQYIADENDVISKRQELLDAYNDLYQLASDAYEANLEALQELQEKYLDSAREIYENETLSEEEKQQKLLELREWYLGEYALLAEENTLYRDDLALASSALLLEVYNQDQEAYESMTDAEKALLDDLVSAHINGFMDLEDKIKDNYHNIKDTAKDVMSNTRQDWTSGAQTIADLWNKDNGSSVKSQVINAYERISDANDRYRRLVDECAVTVERDFSEEGIAGAIQKAEDEVDNLKDKTEDMVSDSIGYLTELQYYVEQLADAWKSVQDEIMDAIELIEEYLKYVGEASRASQQQAAAAQAQKAAAAAPTSSGSSESKSGGGGSSKSSSSSSNKGTPYNVPYKTHYDINSGQNLTLNAYNEDGSIADWRDQLEQKRKMQYKTSNYRTIRQFATGGYTGTWGNGDDNGRLAVLHQKELVLNKDDTANFLSGISMLRDMSSLNGSISNAIASSVAGMIYQLSKTKTGTINNSNTNNNSNINNTFNIEAEFPNAENVNEIREAILSLPNLASQYIANNNK